MKQIRRMLSVLLCIALVLSGLAIPTKDVQAEEYLWDAPTVKKMNFGTQGIIDPAMPNSVNDAWKGCYVYYGNYNGSPVKYRVLDASTTDYSADQTTQTMLLDCDSVLYRTPFDANGEANEEGKYANDWSVSDVKNSLNGAGGFIDTAFTATEKSAIAASTKAVENTLDGDGKSGLFYTPLTGEKIFLPDAKEATRITYGYSGYQDAANRVKKLGNTTVYCWLRSAHSNQVRNAGYVWSDGYISNEKVSDTTIGISPALNLNLSSILLSSVSGTGKSSALTSKSNEIGVTTDADWKLTLLDTNKSIALTQDRSVTKASDGTITVPYTYTDYAASDREKVNQISVMITDKAYGSENAQILYYGALQNIKNAEGTASTAAETSTGTGTFALPSGLLEIWGTDYHVYVMAEHVNADNATDYASEPLEIGVKTAIVTVNIPNIDTPVKGIPLETELEVSGEGVFAKAPVTWKKGETKATGNAESNTTYQALVTISAKDGYTFMDATGAVAGVTLNGKAVDPKNITWNANDTLTIACGAYTTASDIAVNGSQVSVNNDGTVTYLGATNKHATTVTIPTTITIGGITRRVTAIGKNAFRNSNIKSIIIGKNVKTIGKQAFYGCKKLKSVTIGKSVNKIGAKAFYGCSKLKTLTIKSTKLTSKKVGSKAFGKTPKRMTVKIPKKKFKAYKSMLVKKGVSKKAKFKH